MTEPIFKIKTTIDNLTHGALITGVYITACHEVRERIYNMLMLESLNPGIIEYKGGIPTSIELRPNPGYTVQDVFNLAYALCCIAEVEDWTALFYDFAHYLSDNRVEIVKNAFNFDPDLRYAGRVEWIYLAGVSLTSLVKKDNRLSAVGPNFTLVTGYYEEALKCYRSLGTLGQARIQKDFDAVKVVYVLAKREINEKNAIRKHIGELIEGYKVLVRNSSTVGYPSYKAVSDAIDEEYQRLHNLTAEWTPVIQQLNDEQMFRIRETSPLVK